LESTATGLSEAKRLPVVEILNTLLADEHVLYVKTRSYHWNVTGPRFDHLHAFFETQYDALAEIIDDVAERARALGGWAAGSLTEFTRLARLTETAGEVPAADGMIRNLLADHEELIRHLRTDLETCGTQHGDAGTNDFLTGLLARHEKMAWMLRASLS
jgi:starvation-inducible DNA-binding protein